MRFFTGEEMDRLDGQLTDVSDEALHARISRAKEELAGLRKFDRSKMTPEGRLFTRPAVAYAAASAGLLLALNQGLGLWFGTLLCYTPG